jgi:hypothetical protein
LIVSLYGDSPKVTNRPGIFGVPYLAKSGAVSSDGDVYVASEYGQGSARHEVWLYNRRRNTRQFIAYGYHPIVSLDGKKVFFLSADAEGRRRVVRASADAEGLIDVFTAAGHKTELRRSADGKTVLFGVWNQSNKTTELYMLDVGTSTVTKLCDL